MRHDVHGATPLPVAGHQAGNTGALLRSHHRGAALSVLALALLAGACGDGDERCREALALRAPGAPEPRCSNVLCEPARQEPQRPLRFVFDLIKQEQVRNSMGYFDSYAPERKIQNWTCVADLIGKTGARVLPRDELNDVVAVGSHDQVEPGYRLASVNTIQVDCEVDGVCEQCWSRTSAECESDRFCRFQRPAEMCTPASRPQPTAAFAPAPERPAFPR